MLVFPSEVLHGARPVHICHESVVAETQPSQRLRRRNIERIFLACLRSHLLQSVMCARRDREKQHDQRSQHCICPAWTIAHHFMLRFWKIKLAAQITAAVYVSA